MSTTSDGNTYFYVCFGDADLKFGVPTAMAQKIAELTRSSVKKAKISLASALENSEKAIVDAFRKQLHRNPKASKKIAPVIISCCLLSKAALENPDAQGFILEISHGTLPSWSTNAHESDLDGAPGSVLKTYGHYRAMAGRDDIDAFVASRRTEAME